MRSPPDGHQPRLMPRQTAQRTSTVQDDIAKTGFSQQRSHLWYWYRLTGSIDVLPVRRTLRTGQRPMLPLWRIKRYQYRISGPLCSRNETR
jgi:hypothetical protein